MEEIQIELTGICNAACEYCTWRKRTVGKQHMDRQLAFRLLDEAKKLNVVHIRYHGLGESTLHPHLLEIIQKGATYGFDHSLSTNCYILRGKLAEELGAIPSLSMILAIPWVMPEKFLRICIENAVTYLQKIPQNRLIHVQMVCQESVQHQYRRFVDTFLSFTEKLSNVELHLKQPVTWPNDKPNKGFTNNELARHLKVILDMRMTPLSISQGCNMPERFLMVLADGTYVPCCVGMDDWKLGNANSIALQEVWNSQRMQRIRELWKNADDSIPCGYCKKRTDCYT